MFIATNFFKKALFIYIILLCLTSCNPTDLNEPKFNRVISIDPHQVIKIQSAKTYSPIDFKDHAIINILKDLTINIENNNIELKVVTLNSEANRTSHKLTGQFNQFGEAYLNNSNYKRLKATLLCIDLETCNKLIIDFYLLPHKKRVRQFIIEVQNEPTEKSLNRKSSSPLLNNKDSEYLKDDLIIKMAISEFIHQDENINPAGYIGIEPGADFFENEISITPNKPIRSDKKQLYLDFLNNYIFDPSGGQAIDYYSKGKIYNASRIPKEGEGYIKVNRTGGKNYGSGLLIDFISKISQSFISKYPDTLLYINNLSLEKGGTVQPHKSHQNGLDVDISYLPGYRWQLTSVISNQNNKIIPSGPLKLSSKYKAHKDFDFKRNFDFFKQMVETGLISRIFINYNLKRDLCNWGKTQGANFISQNTEVFRRLRAVSYHHDHFHLRLKCYNYKRCMAQEEPPNTPGC